MKNHALSLFAVLALASPCWCQFLQSGHDYGAAIMPILDVLRRGHVSGSLEYSGSCTDQFRNPDFSKLNTPSSDSEPPLQGLREMFANDKDMQVTQEPDRTIRMVAKSVPQDLLNVKIGHISFDEEDKKLPMFFPINVLWVITHSPEVVTFMKDNDIGLVHTIMNEASSSVPRASGELNNVTLSQALDSMLKTFAGLWVYENCPGDSKNKRVVFFSFYRTGNTPQIK